jgi:hypothetical protein
MKLRHFRLDIDNYGDDILHHNPVEETTRLLREVADRLEEGWTEGQLRDLNGNRVGQWYAVEGH